MTLAARIGKAVAATLTTTVVAGALLAGTAGAATAAPKVCHTNTVHVTKVVKVHGHTVRRPATKKVRVCAAQHHSTPAATSPGSAVPTNAHWASGAWPGGSIDATAAGAFASYRGRALDVATVFQVRDSWDTIANSTWAEDAYKGFPGKLVIGLPLLPENDQDGSAGTLADVAAGAHDADFASFARNLLAEGRGDSVIRVGWEFDGDWMKWAATDATTFKAAFRRVVGVIRGIAPNVKIDWNGDLGGSHNGNDDFTQLYPGDDVVDYVGVDAYDRQWFPVTDAASWNRYLNMSYGLTAWKKFAIAHGKLLSLPEWGLYGTETGDSAFYIHKMHDFFATNANVLAYESYFNESQSYIQSSISGPVQNPQASATYRALWSAEG
ncbi:MAG TPA: glycosyl hydrolase [Mycobacteriales bacterium]|nr:glycosyl hydrolase [Mycobacteriales bacterium]